MDGDGAFFLEEVGDGSFAAADAAYDADDEEVREGR